MGYNLNQYSPLSQINKSNVKRLVPVWSTSLSNDTGELAQPTIYNGVMYVVNGQLDLRASTSRPASRSGARRWSMTAAAARVGAAGRYHSRRRDHLRRQAVPRRRSTRTSSRST